MFSFRQTQTPVLVQSEGENPKKTKEKELPSERSSVGKGQSKKTENQVSQEKPTEQRTTCKLRSGPCTNCKTKGPDRNLQYRCQQLF